ncbi:BglG family transcription antiterminator [Bacillus toyonensis]|uniref:BglG family transcription antiterminator n=1 Tax=Bacillus toyonensis TaxID=155322 RepID=UPI0011A42D67|nr:helix-turn-helix domain-containing protein [Bacillus toyonensis]
MLIHQRQQEIINILLQDQKWHTLEEIAERAQCAVKTVRRDLKYLKDQLPSDWRIQVIKGKGIKLYKPPHSSQTSIYSFFKQEDMQFRVLDQLFRGNVRTVNELAYTLYVQVSTLSPVLRGVQQYLNHFDLQLKKNPLRIVGKEAYIVHMFYELYFTTYAPGDWPFSDEVDIFSYITQIEKHLDIQFYPSYKQRFAYWLAVFIQRKKQGYPMKIQPIHKAIVIETLFYQKIKVTSSMLCGMALSEIDWVLITIAVNCCLFVYANRNQYKKELVQHFHNGTPMVYQYAQDLVERLETAFQMPFHEDEDFLFCLLQYVRQISYRYQFIPTITSPTSEWHAQVKVKHPITFQKVRHVYTTWIQQYPFLPRANEEDILVITLQLEAIFQLSQIYRKKVLLYLGDSILWKRYIQGVLYNEFGNTLLIVPEEVIDIRACEIKKMSVDCIIATVPLEKMEVPVIQISVIPTRRELDDIKNFLGEKLNRDI